MSGDPTIRDVLNAIAAFRAEMSDIESRLGPRIDDAERRLGQQMQDMEGRLKAEIAGAFDLHEKRLVALEARVERLEQRLSPSH
ncbi:MAG: hypothetical protein OXI20_14595 [Rhodospirillales bacterium]|nr:hypothetical protein [Rhodospirillales bacterium]